MTAHAPRHRAPVVRLGIVLLAVGAALVPLPAAWVERWYSTGVYARVQPLVTSASNAVPIALFDISVALLLVAAIAGGVRRWQQSGWRALVTRGAFALLVAAAIAYLWFLGMWGLNYRRVPLEQALEYDVARVTREAGQRFAAETTARVNTGRPERIDTDDRQLAAAFADAQRLLGATRTAVVGVPKRSVLTWWFRRAGIDGMTDPFYLEIILNADLLPFERSFTLAHEWAHLAGYADESDANFVAWLTCVRSDPSAQYSGWLAAYLHAVSGMTREELRALPPLSAGVRADLDALARRYGQASPALQAASREVYDSYLRANRVDQGIASYGEVLRLILGTRFEPAWRPVMRGAGPAP